MQEGFLEYWGFRKKTQFKKIRQRGFIPLYPVLGRHVLEGHTCQACRAQTYYTFDQNKALQVWTKIHLLCTDGHA
jgi:hypothetical protein